jgi:hypothetical protein
MPDLQHEIRWAPRQVRPRHVKETPYRCCVCRLFVTGTGVVRQSNRFDMFGHDPSFLSFDLANPIVKPANKMYRRPWVKRQAKSTDHGVAASFVRTLSETT